MNSLDRLSSLLRSYNFDEDQIETACKFLGEEGFSQTSRFAWETIPDSETNRWAFRPKYKCSASVDQPRLWEKCLTPCFCGDSCLVKARYELYRKGKNPTLEKIRHLFATLVLKKEGLFQKKSSYIDYSLGPEKLIRTNRSP